MWGLQMCDFYEVIFYLEDRFISRCYKCVTSPRSFLFSSPTHSFSSPMNRCEMTSERSHICRKNRVHEFINKDFVEVPHL